MSTIKNINSSVDPASGTASGNKALILLASAWLPGPWFTQLALATSVTAFFKHRLDNTADEVAHIIRPHRITWVISLVNMDRRAGIGTTREILNEVLGKRDFTLQLAWYCPDEMVFRAASTGLIYKQLFGEEIPHDLLAVDSPHCHPSEIQAAIAAALLQTISEQPNRPEKQ
jgi:hypothetical protein